MASPLVLSFATKFLAVFLFLKVKGSLPMTYQYLTVEMVNKANTNGGFVGQKMFKTAGKYGFDSLFLTDTSIQVSDGYITHIRPLLKPACDYVLVMTNGGQHNKLGELMSKLIFDATSMYVHQTRYQQIVETASSREILPAACKVRSQKTRNTALSWQGFTIKNEDNARSPEKRTRFWKNYTGQGIRVRNGRAFKAFKQVNVKSRMMTEPILLLPMKAKSAQKHHPSIEQACQN